MEMNFLAILAAAFSSQIVGMIWYNPKVFGNAWMKATGVTEEQARGGNMWVSMLLGMVYAFFISVFIQFVAIHQIGAVSATVDIAGVDPSVLSNYLAAYGNTYRTFGHGALHGAMFGLFFVFPIIATAAMYEKRSFKYTLISGGYWIVSLMIMGGIVCGWK